MTSIAGKKARLKVAILLAGVYAVVAGLDSLSMEIDGSVIDDNEFGVDWNQRLQGLKDLKITASGKLRTPDATGQGVIRNSQLTDGPLFAQYLPDGGTTAGIGTQLPVIVTKYSESPAVDGGIAVSIELQGNGVPTAV